MVRVRTAAAAAALALLSGGCQADSTQPAADPRPPLERAFADGRATLDLSRPPTGEQLGLPPGLTQATYLREDSQPPAQVEVRLPGRAPLQLNASNVRVQVAHGLLANEVLLTWRTTDAEAMWATLSRHAAELGGSTAKAKEMRQDVERDPGTPWGRQVALRNFSYLTVEVAGEHDPGEPLEVNYSFRWPQPQPAPVKGPLPSPREALAKGGLDLPRGARDVTVKRQRKKGYREVYLVRFTASADRVYDWCLEQNAQPYDGASTLPGQQQFLRFTPGYRFRFVCESSWQEDIGWQRLVLAELRRRPTSDRTPALVSVFVYRA